MEIGRWFGKHLLNKKRVFNPKETEPNPQVRIWMDCRSCGYTTSILGRVEGIKITEGTGQLQSIADEHYLELGGGR